MSKNRFFIFFTLFFTLVKKKEISSSSLVVSVGVYTVFSRPPYYSGITADCATAFLDVIVFVCVMKPSAFHSLSTIPLISATVDIRNTILRNSRRGASRER